jgi:hypothetical protein
MIPVLYNNIIKIHHLFLEKPAFFLKFLSFVFLRQTLLSVIVNQ